MVRHLYMKHSSICVIAVFFITTVFPISGAITDTNITQEQGEQQKSARAQYVPNQIVVSVKGSPHGHAVTPEAFCEEYQVELLEKSHRASKKANYDTSPQQSPFAVEVPEGVDLDALLQRLAADVRVQYAEKRLLIPTVPIKRIENSLISPQDDSGSLRSLQWPIHRLGIPDDPDATSIGIGICDTGANLLTDFNNESVVGGWNCLNNTPDFSDAGDHGTHVLSVLIHNETGGLRRSRVHIYRITNNPNSADLIGFSNAVDRAIQDGVKILTCSWGTEIKPPKILRDAVKRAREHGIIIVAATSNNGHDADIVGDIWNVPDSNVIRVTSTRVPQNGDPENADQLAGSSSYGHGWIDVAAPDDSLAPGSTPSSLRWFGGTSIAVPWVATALAITWAQDPTKDWRSVREVVTRSSLRCPALEDKVFAEGRISVSRALQGIFDPPLDTVSIDKAKVKKKKKLTLTVTTTQLNGSPSNNSILRIYAQDMLVGFINGAETSFSTKGQFLRGTNIFLLSSKGGMAEWAVP